MNNTNINAAEQAAKNAETAKAVTTHISEVKENLSKMTLEQLKAEAESLCVMLNEAILDENAKATASINGFMPDVVTALNNECRTACFNELKATPDPIMEACKRIVYTGYRQKERKTPGDDNARYVIEPVDRNIDLLKLHRVMDKVSGKDSNWPHYIERLNQQLTIRVIEELTVPSDGKTAEQKIEERKAEFIDTYRMSDNAKALKAGFSVSNNTQLLKSMQKIVDAMVGEGVCKIRTQDVRKLVRTYTREGRAPASVKCANHTSLCRIIMHGIHAVITENFQYGVEYDKMKK